MNQKWDSVEYPRAKLRSAAIRPEREPRPLSSVASREPLGSDGRRREGSPSRLYVSNLSASATPSGVRQHFAAAGEVLKVELAEQGPGRAPTSAYVTMGTAAEADAAVRKLHGRLFHDRSMMVTPAPAAETVVEEHKVVPKSTRVAISQQYRERQGMVYELDCAGVPLTLRFFFQDEGSSERHVEARVMTPSAELTAQGAGVTREAALIALAQAWQALAVEPPAPELAWTEITAVLRAVRAI